MILGIIDVKRRKKKMIKQKNKFDKIEYVRACRALIEEQKRLRDGDTEEDQELKFAAFMNVFHGKNLTKQEVKEMRGK
jgi:uncharacterized protein YqhQ